MGLIWADYLSVGNGVIDSDHKKLIAAVNSVERAIEARNREALSSKFKVLEILMQAHFENEEKIANAANYPTSEIMIGHRQLMAEIKYMIHKLESTEGSWPDNLLTMYGRYLNDWMIDHIIEYDMEMKPALQNYPYDFVSN